MKLLQFSLFVILFSLHHLHFLLVFSSFSPHPSSSSSFSQKLEPCRDLTSRRPSCGALHVVPPWHHTAAAAALRCLRGPRAATRTSRTARDAQGGWQVGTVPGTRSVFTPGEQCQEKVSGEWQENNMGIYDLFLIRKTTTFIQSIRNYDL